MITKDLQAVDIEGQLGGTTVEMGIHADAVAHIMYQLANLYEDSILAFIRESATNGFDATVETFPEGSAARADALKGGKGFRPIEVTLPTRMAPMFIVRDYGTGMDFETIKFIYSQYGASTKRESNDYNGALGFGCKAPLAYTPQFSVTSVRNGKRVSVSVARKSDGGGTMQVVEGGPGNEVPTTEPQGTTIMVPIKADDVVEVGNTARAFFRYWKPGTVLIDGEQPESIKPTLRLSDTISILKDDEGDRVVMANVAYPIPFGYVRTGLKDGYSLLCEVPTGDLEFTPSREGIKVKQENRDALAKVEAEYKRVVKGAIQRKVDEATSKPDALSAMIYWRSALPTEARSEDDTYRWRGATLPSKWESPRQPGGDWPFIITGVRSHPASRHEKKDRVGARRFSRDFFVTGWTSGQVSSPQKERLNMWRQAETPELSYADQRETEFVLCRAEDIPADVRQWIDPKRIVTWKHIKDTYKIQTGGTGSAYGGWKQVKGSYEDVWTEDGPVSGETPASKIRQDKPIYYFQTREQHLAQAATFPTQLHKEFTVVQLQANRVGKFCRDFPKARHLKTALDECYRKWRQGITQDHLDALSIKNTYRYGRVPFDTLDAAKVDDPAIKRAIRLAKLDLTSIQSRDRVFSQILRKSLTVPQFKDPMERYPLAVGRHSGTRAMNHIYMYLNAAYAADQAAKATTTP